MKRLLIAAGFLAFALVASPGCGDKNTSGGQPKLSNPDDPKLKSMQPASPGGAPKNQPAPVAQ